LLGASSLQLLAACLGQSGELAADETQPLSAAEISAALDSSAPQGQPNQLLELQVEPGHVVRYYEPTPGALFMTETLQPSQNTLLNRGDAVDALDLFSELRPGTAVPAELQDAYERMQERASFEELAPPQSALTFGGGTASEPATPSDVSGPVGVSVQALTSSSNPANFVNSYKGCDWANAASLCRINWSNGFWASWSPSSSATCVVDHFAGNGITVGLTAGATKIPTSQAVHTVQVYTWALSSNTVHRLDITNASGDSFHVGCRFFK